MSSEARPLYVFKVEGMEANNGLIYPITETSKPLTSGHRFHFMSIFTQWTVELKEVHLKNLNCFILK